VRAQAALGILVLASSGSAARADSPWGLSIATDPPRIAGFRVRGDSKVTETTVRYLSHLHIGDAITADQIPAIEEALLSSELFKSVKVTLEDGPDGVLVVAELDDKMSWIAAPTLYVLPSNRAFGVGFAENDFAGRDQKFLIYGQLGTQTSLLFATFLDPNVHGSKLQYRLDLYLERRYIDEYANPPSDPTDKTIARSTRQLFLDAGLLVGWTFKWWLVGDFRLRGAYVTFRDPQASDGTPLPTKPEKDGWDTTAQLRLTLDHRIHRFGVTWGPFVQALVENSVPGLDTYGYTNSLLRAYYSWRVLEEHQLEVRGLAQWGYHLPFHEENALGGVSDLRGYPTDQFRGDINYFARGEYSFPLLKWRMFAFRGLGFYDLGYSYFRFPRPADRDYLPNDLANRFRRSDVGAGFRVYVKSIVLPLLGFDWAWGIEGRGGEITFEVGLTDF
jgi:outer membrane protein assembly factor BamA